MNIKKYHSLILFLGNLIYVMYVMCIYEAISCLPIFHLQHWTLITQRQWDSNHFTKFEMRNDVDEDDDVWEQRDGLRRRNQQEMINEWSNDKGFDDLIISDSYGHKYPICMNNIFWKFRNYSLTQITFSTLRSWKIMN